jgi:hypothetical protein
MSERKTFFENLEPKSALVVGLVSGFMTLCTAGFFVLGFMMVKGGSISLPSSSKTGEALETDKPKVELFVMSYCPFGLQMQKAYLPAWELLKNKADIDVKFVSYAMHEKKEIDENTLQYCIQKEQNNKYIPYLKCFTASGDANACMATAGVNSTQASNCVASANRDFGITKEYDDRSRWLSGQFPIYPIHKDLNDKYGVQGSPTLVVNGVQVENVARTPEGVKQVICAAFKNKPAECDQTLSNNAFGSGFGTQVGPAPAAGVGCGV